MRILILNWRCPRNPKAGGAEILTLEIAKRFVAAGDDVEWFAASFPGASPEESIEGVRVVRSGQQWTVHWKAFQRYRGRLRGRFDLVIDEINTMPFFTPLWAGIPVLVLIFQLAREVWWYESIFPVSAIGFLGERFYLGLYRRTPAMTISESTASDLRRLGFRREITVMPIGIDRAVATREYQKSAAPSFIYVGRLAPSKRVNDIINAFALFRRTTGAGELTLIGVGASGYTDSLKRLVDRLGLGDSVAFAGRVSANEKRRQMSEAHVLLMASVREGWGLVVTEAGACGTPAVVYNVPGLRDSVRNGETGLVVDSKPRAMADGMLRLWNDAALYVRLANEVRVWSSGFSFEVTTAAVRREVTRLAGPSQLHAGGAWR